MSVLNTDENRINFLLALYQKAEGDTAFVISMYEIGESIGLDRDIAQKTAEALMGEGLVEIKTLSGGIGITENGITEIKVLTGEANDGGSVPMSLSGAAVISEDDQKLIETVILNLKNAVNQLKLDFNDMADLFVDIKTIELQLTATSPKTPIIRECFKSIKTGFKNSQNTEVLKQITDLLGE